MKTVLNKLWHQSWLTSETLWNQGEAGRHVQRAVEQLSINLWSEGNQNKQSAQAQRVLLVSAWCSLLALSPSQAFGLFLTTDVVVLTQAPTGGKQRNSLLEHRKKNPGANSGLWDLCHCVCKFFSDHCCPYSRLELSKVYLCLISCGHCLSIWEK